MGRTQFYHAQVVAAIERATNKVLRQIAFQGEALTKVNINTNDQIDTGFMINSVYAKAPNDNNFSDAKARAEARNPDAQMSPEIATGTNEALIAVGAEYAVYQEAHKSFLWKAVEQLRAEFPQIVKTVRI